MRVAHSLHMLHSQVYLCSVFYTRTTGAGAARFAPTKYTKILRDSFTVAGHPLPTRRHHLRYLLGWSWPPAAGISPARLAHDMTKSFVELGVS